MRPVRALRSRRRIRQTQRFSAEITAGLERYRAKLVVPARPSGLVLLPTTRRRGLAPIRPSLNAAGLATVRFDIAQELSPHDPEELTQRLAAVADRVRSRTGHAVGVHATGGLAGAGTEAARISDGIGALSIEGERSHVEAARWLAQRLHAGEDLDEVLRGLADRRTSGMLRRAAAAAALAAGAVGVTPSAAGAAITATWNNGTGALSISLGTGDSVVVTCSDFGDVLINGTDHFDGTADCDDVTSLLVAGAAGNETIDLAGVSASDYTFQPEPTVLGLAGDDSITGSQLDDQIWGGCTFGSCLGLDTLTGGAGTDTLRELKSGGNLTLTNTSLSEDFTVVDLISGFERAWLTGGSGDTLIDASAFSGESTLEGGERCGCSGMVGSGDDTLLGSVGDAQLEGVGGDDSLRGGPGDDTLRGEYFNPAEGTLFVGRQTLEGAGGFDQLAGGTLSDRYVFAPGIGASDDVIVDENDLPVDQDTLDFSAFTDGTAFHVNLGGGPLASQAALGWQVLGSNSIENALGGSGSDTLLGNEAANSLVGGAGNDTLTGFDGNDTTVGGLGNDIHAFEDDGNGVAETDLIRELSAGGTDEASFLDVTTPVTADLRPGTPNNLARYMNRTVNLDPGATGPAAKPTVENLTGGSASDSLTGSGGINVISGGAGDDTFGATFKDTVQGGEGTGDRADVKGFDANEVYNPDAAGLSGVELLNVFMTGGNDRINIFSVTGLVGTTLEGGTGNDTITGSVSADTLRGQAGNDVVDGRAGDDRINGVDGTDDLVGGDGNDTIFGGLLHDLLVGGNGHDSLLGEDGDDTLNGGNDNDTLNGGPGNDSLNGGAGTNVLIP